MGISKAEGKVEGEEPWKETGQDWSTGRESIWRTSEKAGGVRSVGCCRGLGHSGKAGIARPGPSFLAFCNTEVPSEKQGHSGRMVMVEARFQWVEIPFFFNRDKRESTCTGRRELIVKFLGIWELVVKQPLLKSSWVNFPITWIVFRQR